ncbi:sulfide/dihydroorotate dehydrogenase-like FAD/NAD-binding protein [Thermohalobacter berrensis]|uniref:2-polyprenylphenol hydroxylase n=1 Tax=Thermohalobacter berrensis TaxID=99594 RepID=A0A419TAN1_9FIRM|nr:sulfide/dihydroorotate dehydrogenase-like FAD/NAD-binding protein [Thermohalobacter berrensis]RKD34539.1 2-polyprenylphenol hydroxylase [Thermohalobacter berrensis]
MGDLKLKCVDAGSEFCPCYLAETNDCITCSHLQGKDFCDCNWTGVCIYQEYVWNGYKSKNSREIIGSKIINKKNINKKCVLLKLKVTKTLARQLREPGSYVFLRNPNVSEYFDVPMSVMDADELNGYIYIAYKIHGTKTKKLDESNKNVLLRGPYWNGVLGFKNLKTTSNSNCLVIARGIAQAPTVLVVKKLIRNNNNVTVILDKGNINEIFIEEFIKGLNVNIIQENLKSSKGKFLVEKALKEEKVQLVFIGGSSSFQYELMKKIDGLNLNPKIVITNNKEMCCGEGICGSCSIQLEDGSIIKLCKTQIDVEKLLKGGLR